MAVTFCAAAALGEPASPAIKAMEAREFGQMEQRSGPADRHGDLIGIAVARGVVGIVSRQRCARGALTLSIGTDPASGKGPGPRDNPCKSTAMMDATYRTPAAPGYHGGSTVTGSSKIFSISAGTCGLFTITM